jgi:SP family sugar:H+ symporter-like MFS transporter
MAASLFVAGGLGVNSDGLPVTTGEQHALVAMICIYVFFFNLAWGPLAWVIA